MSKIKKVYAREILDSRGNPTVEARVFLESGFSAKASVPSGASTGTYEALELRDGDQSHYLGHGVLTACKNVNNLISPALINQEISKQNEIDQTMITLDGTPNKRRLGANAILSVSLACARVASHEHNLPLYQYLRQLYNLPLATYQLPTPMFNVINGGKHADSGLAFQEFMIVPQKDIKFSEKLQLGVSIFNNLKNILAKQQFAVSVGDEGGFAPRLKTTKNVLELLISAIHYAKYRVGEQVFIGFDAAASVFYNAERGTYQFEGNKYSGEKMISFYLDLAKKYPLISLEDPLAEDDWQNWQLMTARLKNINPQCLIIGDDLFTTNINRLLRGIEVQAANTLLVKLNQIGTLTETMNCLDLALKHNYQLVISHRSGETNDDFIADLAVAVNAGYIKAGAPDRGERVAKYNRLLEIEQELMHSK